ncbi:MAG: M23 family metallopeptidase [Clostridia bacterium]|nr:M23 family metallopeptidase [Clostridia bacterium]
MALHEPPPRQTDTGLRPTARGGQPVRLAHPAVPKESEERQGKGRPLPLVAVQCIACGVAVLLALLLRTAGGSAYEQVRQSFRESLLRNDLPAMLALLWDGDPLESEPPSEEETAVPPAEDAAPPDSQPNSTTDSTAPSGARLPPAGAVAVPLRVNLVAYPPLEEGTVTSAYGYRQNPTASGEQFHHGVDIAAPAGTPIAAMFGGRVTAVGESDSLGRYIRLEHGDGVEVLYAHCASVTAAEGAVVRAGERVAAVGNTGDSTGSHLHVQISCDGVVYNPYAVVPLSRYA